MKIKIIALSLMTLLTSHLAIAFCPVPPLPCGWYLEGNIGKSYQSNSSYGNSASIEGSGTAWNVNAGYKFMPYFATELGYTKFPNTKVKNFNISTATDTHYGIDLAGKGILPIVDTGLELFAKVGATYVNSNLSLNHKVVATAAGLKAGSHNSTNLFIGAGAEYSFTANMPVNIQWQRSNADKKSGVFNVYSIGIAYMMA